MSGGHGLGLFATLIVCGLLAIFLSDSCKKEQNPRQLDPADSVPHEVLAAPETSSLERSQKVTVPAEVNPAQTEGLEWWHSPERVSALQAKWSEVHAWNTTERLAEFEAKRIGTEFLHMALELSGVLLEEMRPLPEDFSGLDEARLEAVASLLQRSASHRMRLGENPFLGLNASSEESLRDGILERGLEYPPDHMILAANQQSVPVHSNTRAEIAKKRIDFLKQISPLVAEQDHRNTTALHLMAQEGLGETYRPSIHLKLLDPTYETLLLQIQDMHLRYRDEIRALVNQ